MDSIIDGGSAVPLTDRQAARDIDACRSLPIAGIEPMTTIDFPGRLAAAFFVAGCPWRCRYCHNHLLQNSGEPVKSWQEVESFLDKRRGFLEGIVISGGEPCMHKSLPAFLAMLREKGYATAVHTNGYYSAMLRRILMTGLVDFVAMDVKAPPRAYDRVTGGQGTCIEVSRSIDLIINSDCDYEFRTTYHPDILSEHELIETTRAIAAAGAKRFYLQRFRNIGVADKELSESCELAIIPDAAVELAESLFDTFEVR